MILLKYLNKMIKFILIFLIVTFIHSCSKTNVEPANKDIESTQQISKIQRTEKNITAIKSEDHFQKVIEQAGDRLLIFDLYADWCQPCRILTPILEEIAEEKSDLVSFYKIDVDKHMIIAKMFQARTIPLVVFLKNKNVVKNIIGVQPKTVYLDAISEHAR